jgi:hypothetical protein
VIDESDEEYIKEIMRSICQHNAVGVILAKQPGKNGRLQFILMNTDQHDAITVLAEVMVQLAKSKPDNE